MKSYMNDKKEGNQTSFLEDDEYVEEEDNENEEERKVTKRLRNSLKDSWSDEFLRKVDQLTCGVSYSEVTEVDLLAELHKQKEQDQAILAELSEFPTEAEFLQRLNENEITTTPKPKEDEISVPTEELNPGLLDLYNSIQTDIDKILDGEALHESSSKESLHRIISSFLTSFTPSPVNNGELLDEDEAVTDSQQAEAVARPN